MCTILFAWQTDATQPFLAAANRDEFHHRPTQAAHWQGDVFCGVDLRAGGTWMGIHRQGRFAAVTNFREPAFAAGEKSRGNLAMSFLTSTSTPQAFCQQLAKTQAQYGPFNLLVSDGSTLWYMSNRGAEPRALAPGFYGLSNGLINAPWPKVTAGVSALREHFYADDAQLFALLKNTQQPADETLPNTGVGIEMERVVAPLFIQAGEYGTRSSAVVRLNAAGEWSMAEQNWDPEGNASGPIHSSH